MTDTEYTAWMRVLSLFAFYLIPLAMATASISYGILKLLSEINITFEKTIKRKIICTVLSILVSLSILFWFLCWVFSRVHV